MKLTPEENQFIESLYALSGVDKEDIEKVFEAFITFSVFKMYDKIEKRPTNSLITETIEFPIPHFAKIKVHIKDEEATKEEIAKYRKDNGGYIPRIQIEATPSDLLLEDIRRVGKNQTTHIEERIQLQIFDSLTKKKSR
jgi:hypothetical protein